jgi:hypothetical protein
MTKSLQATTLEHLGTQLREQVLEVATLQLAVDIQSSRVASTQRERGVPKPGHERTRAPDPVPMRTPDPDRNARSPRARGR